MGVVVDMTKMRWFMEHYWPKMISGYAGGTCKRCYAWILSEIGEYENYEKHLAWHKELETKLEAKWTM